MTPRHRPQTIADMYPEALPEREVQRAVLQYLERAPTVAFAFRLNTASGFLLDATTWKRLLAGAVARAAMARFIRFAFPGASDILGMLTDGRFLAVECKSASGRLTPDQAAFLSRVNQCGGCGFVARSIVDCLQHLPPRTTP
jgi:hypothetical protein